MSLFSNLFKRALGIGGAIIGGPWGAAAGVLGGLLGGNDAPAQQSRVPFPDVSAQASTKLDPQALAMLQGYLQGNQGGESPVVYNARKALAGAPLQQTSNQQGGQASPGYPGMGLFRDKLPALGPGKGAGGTDTGTVPETEKWRQVVMGQLNAPGQFTQGAAGAYRGYLQQALSGNAGLPQDAYQRNWQQGMSAVNAQAQQSRASLGNALGSRGLLQSGMMGRGLVDVERARLGGVGALAGGLAQQDLEARRQAQQSAFGIMPSLISAESGSAIDRARAYLSLRQTELAGGSLALQQDQQAAAERASKWDMLASAAGAFAAYKYRPQGEVAKDKKYY
jgi:hypothetical protein